VEEDEPATVTTVVTDVPSTAVTTGVNTGVRPEVVDVLALVDAEVAAEEEDVEVVV
jgi:hypothetical protein